VSGPIENDGWMASATEDWVRMGVVLTIGRRIGERVQFVTRLGPQGEREIVMHDAALVSSPDESIMIPRGMALSILDALLRLYGGGVDTRTARADFEHERARVDTMINHLMTRGETEHIGEMRKRT
jgi:hypothetical protein